MIIYICNLFTSVWIGSLQKKLYFDSVFFLSRVCVYKHFLLVQIFDQNITPFHCVCIWNIHRKFYINHSGVNITPAKTGTIPLLAVMYKKKTRC